jgi:hypothetical protein
MDLILADIGPDGDAAAGDEAILFGHGWRTLHIRRFAVRKTANHSLRSHLLGFQTSGTDLSVV